MKPIDLRKLAKNFSEEKSKEDRHWQRNDAKFRAVHQRCATYDEFRQIVEAAHLRPLNRNETLTLDRRPISWNQPAAKPSSLSSDVTIPSDASIVQPQVAFPMPKTITEFMQQWRRIPNETKLDYLRQLNNLDNIFQTDIPTDLLQELPRLYQRNASTGYAEIIVDVLLNMSRSKRFELIKSFLSEKDRYELGLLFTRLCSFVNLRYSVFLLREMYF